MQGLGGVMKCAIGRKNCYGARGIGPAGGSWLAVWTVQGLGERVRIWEWGLMTTGAVWVMRLTLADSILSIAAQKL